jgi:hypothetical protein
MNKHIDATTYLQWEDGMYVMLDDLEDDYERALVENSLRGSAFEDDNYNKMILGNIKDCMGVFILHSGAWLTSRSLRIPLTRAQALYIATGETTCTK